MMLTLPGADACSWALAPGPERGQKTARAGGRNGGARMALEEDLARLLAAAQAGDAAAYRILPKACLTVVAGIARRRG